MEDLNEQAFGFMKLAPELQVKVFEALPSPRAAVALRLTCRDLNSLFVAYKKQIETAIRDNMVAPFYDYYAFLGRLHIPESDIKHPPVGGWPNITLENCAEFGKSDFAVDVLRHLPYIVEDKASNYHNIDFKSNVLDYSKATRKQFGDSSLKTAEITHEFQGPVSRHKVVIAEGYESGGVDLILDTSTGEIFEELIRVEPGANLPVREYFERKMRQCVELRTVFAPGEDAYWGGFDSDEAFYDAEEMEEEGEPSQPDQNFWLADDFDRDWVRHLYRKFGWPGEGWRKEEGLKAIAEYRDRRNAEVEEREAEEQRRRADVLSRIGPTVAVLHSL